MPLTSQTVKNQSLITGYINSLMGEKIGKKKQIKKTKTNTSMEGKFGNAILSKILFKYRWCYGNEKNLYGRICEIVSIQIKKQCMYCSDLVFAALNIYCTRTK